VVANFGLDGAGIPPKSNLPTDLALGLASGADAEVDSCGGVRHRILMNFTEGK